MLELDLLSRRYGQLPSELIKTSLQDYGFNLFVASVAIEEEKKGMVKANGKK